MHVMTLMSDIDGAQLFAEDGSHLGVIEHLLFHPSEPRAVAVQVKPDPAFLIVGMPSAFLAWPDLVVREDGILWRGMKLPSRRAAERALGLDVETTVIWRGMPARARGRVIGTVADATLAADGSVMRLDVSTGGLGDLAVGRFRIDGPHVLGFDGAAVALDAEPDELESSGGAAKQAAIAAAAVKEQASAVGQAAGDAVADASYLAGRAIRSAANSAPAKKARSAFSGLADAFREGYRGEGDGE